MLGEGVLSRLVTVLVQGAGTGHTVCGTEYEGASSSALCMGPRGRGDGRGDRQGTVPR